MTVILAAHGSPDPRHAVVMEAIRAGVAARLGDVRLGWLGHHSPELGQVVSEALAEDPETIVVPLLLAPAFHARVDVPAGAGGARISDVLAPDRRLIELLDFRLREAMVESPVGSAAEPLDGLVLAAAGSTDPAADELVCELASEWGASQGLPVEVGYAAAEPSIAAAIDALRSRGLNRLAVGSLFLAPGRLHDAVATEAAAAGVRLIAAPLGAHALLVDLVCDRALATLAMPVKG